MSAAAEQEIRALVAERVAAIAAHDLDALLRHHDGDVASYDVLPPLRTRGAATVRERARRWLTAYRDGPGYEVRDLEVTAGEDVAFCHYLYRVTGTLTAGAEVGMWVRATIGLARRDGDWRIVHEHQSVPFDPETGRASLDLTP